VLRTSMPEATVDENRQPSLGKNDVSAPPQAGKRSHIHPISQASGVQKGSYSQLWFSIPSALRLHSAPNIVAACPRPAWCRRHSATLRSSKSRGYQRGDSLPVEDEPTPRVEDTSSSRNYHPKISPQLLLGLQKSASTIASGRVATARVPLQ
jgi:hypothetical protein